eukprot:GILJ01033978.1.p1 GENE.GILJ01033978.1~~GILJ01033978.1.p1  ORF type:complete len:172 (-),score=17.36 GILJ01033978.1:19-534(-)
MFRLSVASSSRCLMVNSHVMRRVSAPSAQCILPVSASAPLVASQVRWAASCPGMGGFTDIKYNDAADGWLDDTSDVIDTLCEDYPQISDISNNGGVLTLDMGEDIGTFILNKQAPKRQLWLSSPISGPSHYDMMDEEGRVWWKCDKTGRDLSKLLEKELSEVLKGCKVSLP